MYAGKNHNINQKHYTTLYIFRDMRKKHVLNYTMVVTRVGIEKKLEFHIHAVKLVHSLRASLSHKISAR